MNTYTITMSAGEALFLWCLRNGKSIAQLARAIGQPRQRTSDILRGYSVPTEPCKSFIMSTTQGDVSVGMWDAEAAGSWLVTVTAGEYLMTLIRRKEITTADFCERTQTNTTRISRIIRGYIIPTAREQAAIGKQFKELKGAWK